MLTALGRGIRAGHTGEPVAAAEIGLDEIAVPAQRFAQCGDLSLHVLLRNNDAWPHTAEQLVFGDQGPVGL